MNVELIHLNIQCTFEDCKGFNYYEDESGFYVCATCGTVSQIRCGADLDYTFPLRSTKKISKNEDDEVISDDGMVDENNELDAFSIKNSLEGETLFNFSTTNIKSSRIETSSYNDLSSVYSKSIKRKKTIEIKTPNEILIEIQNYFENIINILVKDFFDKDDNTNNINNLKRNYFIKIINFDENEEKIFYEIAKKIWIFFLAKKYKDIKNPVYKRKKLIRSRRNYIEEEREIKKNKENENDENNISNNNNNTIVHNKIKIIGKIKKKKKIKQKEIRLHEQLKMRRITERNVYNVFNENNLLTKFSFGQTKTRYKSNNNNKNNFYNESNFNPISHKKNMLKKFIEEYDQVINFIKKDKCFDIIFETEEEKEKINITNVIEYELLL